MKASFHVSLFLLLLPFLAFAQNTRPLQPQRGAVITESCQIMRDTYYFESYPGLAQPVLTIKGSYITVDFKQAVIIGNRNYSQPDSFAGLGILVTGEHVTIKNLRVRGFKIGLLGEYCTGCEILDSDFSYNYRPRLYSGRQAENICDWLEYDINDREQWKGHGAGIFLNFCDSFKLARNKATGNQNAALIVDSHFGEAGHNNFAFNSGVGLGLYRSSYNYIHHNYLDFNVRGFSLGEYARGQDAAGLLLYEQCIFNRVEYNTATHCGQGLFLWGGQTTLITGTGGSNDNELRWNDFSYAASKGMEATFSRNLIEKNLVEHCEYGLWGNYSFDSKIQQNLLLHNTTAIAIGHGQMNLISGNLIQGAQTGVHCWAKYPQPEWPYVKKKETPSLSPKIEKNIFVEDEEGIRLELTARPLIKGNTFDRCKIPMQGDTLVSQDLSDLDQDSAAILRASLLRLDTVIRSYYPFPFRGKNWIRMGTYGPHDYRSPLAWLKEQKGDTLIFSLLGPYDFAKGSQSGNWSVKSSEGLQILGKNTGTFPATLLARIQPGSSLRSLVLNYQGPDYTDPYGQIQPASKARSFGYSHLDPQWRWKLHFYPYSYNRDLSAADNYKAFETLGKQPALDSLSTADLRYNWWHAPTAKVGEDHFACIATTETSLAPGQYTLRLTADDALRFYINGKLQLEHWEPGESRVYTLSQPLAGQVAFRIEKAEDQGFSTLQLDIEKDGGLR